MVEVSVGEMVVMEAKQGVDGVFSGVKEGVDVKASAGARGGFGSGESGKVERRVIFNGSEVSTDGLKEVMRG